MLKIVQRVGFFEMWPEPGGEPRNLQLAMFAQLVVARLFVEKVIKRLSISNLRFFTRETSTQGHCRLVFII